MFHEIFLKRESFTKVVMERFYLLFSPCLLYYSLYLLFSRISELGFFFALQQ